MRKSTLKPSSSSNQKGSGRKSTPGMKSGPRSKKVRSSTLTLIQSDDLKRSGPVRPRLEPVSRAPSSTTLRSPGLHSVSGAILRDVQVSPELGIVRNLRTGINIAGSWDGGLSIHARIPFAQTTIFNDTSITQHPGYAFSGSVNGTSIVTVNPRTLAFSPFRSPFYQTNGSSNYDTGVVFANNGFMNEMASNFQRYRITSDLRVMYEPQSSADLPGRFALAFSEDPCNVVFGLQNAGVNPSTYALDDTPNSIFFSPWCGWTAEFPMRDRSWKYTWTPPLYSVNQTGTPFDIPTIRDSTLCAISCTSCGGNTDTLTGRLFLEYTVEFMDPLPVYSGNIVGSPVMRRLLRPAPTLPSTRPIPPSGYTGPDEDTLMADATDEPPPPISSIPLRSLLPVPLPRHDSPLVESKEPRDEPVWVATPDGKRSQSHKDLRLFGGTVVTGAPGTFGSSSSSSSSSSKPIVR
jgi:hypothetical protein